LNDTPAIIEIFGSREQRIFLIQQYLNTEGKLSESTESVFNSDSLKMVANLIDQQKTALQSEQFEQQQRTMVSSFLKKNKKKKNEK
jgi:hypothetical protein